MHYFDSTSIDGDIYLHQVGNKQNGDSLILSSEPITVEDTVKKNLMQFFLSHFNQTEYYHFIHESSLLMNEVYSYVSSIFDDLETISEQSRYLAQILFRVTTNPNIKCGEFYVVHFRNCLIDGVMTDAVGIFKSENKESFFKIMRKGHSFEVIQEFGVNTKKIDKGCLVFNLHSDSGYVLSIIDNSNRGEAKYWIEDFLQVKRYNDSYTKTQNAVAMCKGFISQLPENVAKSEKAIMMNRVLDGLKSEEVVMEKLAVHAFGKVLASSEFKTYRANYESTHKVRFDNAFQGKPEAVKRRATGSMTTIKLDNNFDVNIHGDKQFIELGYDEQKGMKYYKLYFNEEK
jgi:hypothetical protein